MFKKPLNITQAIKESADSSSESAKSGSDSNGKDAQEDAQDGLSSGFQEIICSSKTPLEPGANENVSDHAQNESEINKPLPVKKHSTKNTGFFGNFIIKEDKEYDK